MANKSIIIIGAGISGLAAGCYARMNGYDTQIFEMHNIPGGVCTAWERKGFTIDGCLHWLVGSSPNSPFNNYWKELGMIQDKKFIYMDELYQFESPEGQVFHCYTDIDRLEQHMKELAQEDAGAIEDFTRTVRRFIGFNTPVEKAPELYNAIDGLKILFRMRKHLGIYRKWSKISMKELIEQFKNPFLHAALESLLPSEFSSAIFMITLAELHEKTAGYPVGGSFPLTLSLEKRYVELGGKLRYRSGVEKIMVEHNRAVGVRLADGTEFKADYVISAADGHAAIFDMLGGNYVDESIRNYYKNNLLFPPLVYIGLGINSTFQETPKIISGIDLALEKPIMIGGQEINRLPVRIHNFDETLSPPGKTLLTVAIESDFAYWEELRQDLLAYQAEKQRIATEVVIALTRRFPGISNQLEMWDVATPVTFYRYTGNWQGSYEGWMPTPDTVNLRIKKELPGLQNFYMAGQWVQPGGGLPSAVMTGSHVIQILCKRDKKKYLVKS